MNSEAKGFRNTNADHLVMLLSTDWFLPYWGSTIGLSLDENQKKLFQQGCRCIVDQLIDGAEQYYLIAFTLERIERTRDEFWKLLAKAGVDEEVLSRIRELLSPDPQTGGTRWLLTLNTKMLVQGSRDLPVGDTVPELDPEIREALRDWNFRQPQHIDLKDACMKSATSWTPTSEI